MKRLQGKKIKLWTESKFYYCGTVTDENDDFVFLFDDKKQREFMIKRDVISQVEFLDSEAEVQHG